MTRSRFASLAAGCILATTATYSVAHEVGHGADARRDYGQTAWGIAGTPGSVQRTIEVSMTDNMRFTPDKISVREGETVRFLVRNDGQILHEFVLGTREMLDEHAAMMLRTPEMPHDAPYMVHVDPGKTGEVLWTFNRVGAFEFACLIPGHYQAGMVGTVQVEK